MQHGGPKKEMKNIMKADEVIETLVMYCRTLLRAGVNYD